MSKLSRISNGVLALFLAVFSSGLVQLYNAPTASAYNTDPSASFSKVWVCKYKGTPGVDEEFKSGKNPISVDAGNYKLGDQFTDAQGRSLVIAWDDGDSAPDRDTNCPAPNTDWSVTAVAPTTAPVCGANNDIVTLAETVGVTYSQSGWTNNSNTVTATANPGYVLAGTSSWILTDDNIACPVEDTPIQPETPVVSDFCGTDKDDVTAPADSEGVSYSVSHTGTNWTVTATAADNYVLDVAGTDYVLNQDGTATWTATLTDQECKVTICHRTDAVNNPYVKITVSEEAVDGVAGNSGSEADHYGEHQGPLASSEEVAQELKDDHVEWGDIIPPVGNHQGLNWTTIGQAMLENDCNYVTEVTPAEPAAVDFCYDDQDGVQIPETEGVSYKVNGDATEAGFVPFTGEELTITAEAEAGYVIKDGADTEWTFDQSDFTNESCLEIKKEFKSYEDIDKNGVVTAGDKVNWTITVTNNGDVDLDEAFEVEIKDLDITITIDKLDAGQSHSEDVTTTISADDMRACKATNTAAFSAWRYEAPLPSLASLEAAVNTPLATGSDTAEYNFTCPTPGKGNYNPPATPEAPSAPDTGVASQLPQTGTNSAAPIFTLIAATLIYGALYVARRKFEQ